MDASEVKLTRVELPQARMKQLADKVNERLAKAAAQGHPLGRFHDPSRVYKHLLEANAEGLLDVYVDQEGEIAAFIMYAPMRPWWSTKSVLVEEVVMLFRDDLAGFGRVATTRLEDIALACDCAMIHVGNIFTPADGMVKNLYTRKAGFQYQYPMFIKVLD